MDWKEDSNLLAKKILTRIENSKDEISYSDLEAVAVEKDISLDIFEAAMAQLHRHKKVTQRTKKEEIYYKAVPKVTVPKKPAKQCLVKITLKTSPFFNAIVCPLSGLKKENDVWYRECAVLTPKSGTNRTWICPADIGLPNIDFEQAGESAIPFPEIDMSMIFLRPAEMLAYKAAAKGIPLHMMKRIHK